MYVLIYSLIDLLLHGADAVSLMYVQPLRFLCNNFRYVAPFKFFHIKANVRSIDTRKVALPNHLEFEKMTYYVAVLQNYLKFSPAPSAIAINTPYCKLKRRKKRKNFRLRLRRAENCQILYGKNVHFLKCSWFCLSLEKLLWPPMLACKPFLGK